MPGEEPSRAIDLDPDTDSDADDILIPGMIAESSKPSRKKKVTIAQLALQEQSGQLASACAVACEQAQELSRILNHLQAPGPAPRLGGLDGPQLQQLLAPMPPAPELQEMNRRVKTLLKRLDRLEPALLPPVRRPGQPREKVQLQELPGVAALGRARSWSPRDERPAAQKHPPGACGRSRCSACLGNLEVVRAHFRTTGHADRLHEASRGQESIDNIVRRMGGAPEREGGGRAELAPPIPPARQTDRLFMYRAD